MSDQFDHSFFNPGTRIEGDLEIQGDVRLDGQIEGKVIGTATVTVSEKATVKANIHAPTVVVDGSVRGELHARDRLELHRTAKVTGALRAPRLRIDEGALFEGECRMAPSETARSAGQGGEGSSTGGAKDSPKEASKQDASRGPSSPQSAPAKG